jgi:hypothetical protein
MERSLILKGYFAMRKNKAGMHIISLLQQKHLSIEQTCPQFLWINLCLIARPRDKLLILIKEVCAPKN